MFLSNMSHGLRTLNAIIGYSDMLLEEAEEATPEQTIADVGKIRAAGQHLLRVINDILDLKDRSWQNGPVYRAIQPQQPGSGCRNHPATLNREAWQYTAPRTGRRSWRDHSRPHQGSPDPIQPALNASKFTEHGTITLHVALSTPDTLPLWAPADNSRPWSCSKSVIPGSA